MKKILFLFAFFGSVGLISAADVKDSVTFKYLTAVKNDIAPIVDHEKNFASKPKSFCPVEKGINRFMCMSEYISGLTLKSSTQVVLLMGRVAHESALPEKKSSSQNFRILAVIENSLLIFERTNLSKFHLSTLQAVSGADKKELALLKADDEQMLAQKIKKFTGPMAKKLAEVEKSEEIKKSESDSAKLKELKIRLKNLKNRKWKYNT